MCRSTQEGLCGLHCRVAYKGTACQSCAGRREKEGTAPMVKSRMTFCAAGLVIACNGGTSDAPSAAERVAPVLLGGEGCLVDEISGAHQGFVLHLNVSPDVAERVTFGFRAYDASGGQIPQHVLGCARSEEGEFPRTTGVTLAPGAGCFPTLFVSDAPSVDQIIVFPERRVPIEFFRRGDPVCTTGNYAAPASVELRFE